jgi:hypothetical protein
MFWGVAAFTPDRSADVTLTLHQFGNLAFIATDQYFIFQFVALAVVCLRPQSAEHSPFPRWLGYLTLWSAFSIEIGVAAFVFKTGPFAWNGLLDPPHYVRCLVHGGLPEYSRRAQTAVGLEHIV